MKTLKYTNIKCSLNKFCKNDYLKSKINELVLNVNKIIFEGYVLANLHIIWLLDEDKEVPPLNQKVFQNVLALVRVMLYCKEMDCKDEELVTAFEKHYKVLRLTGYQPGYRDYMNGIIGTGCTVDMETATKNHLTLNFYKQCS
jgi:hypothetical protein